MKNEINRIINHVENIYSGYCWTDQNYFELLHQIPSEYVNETPKGFNNSIHRLCRHIIATEDVVIKRIKGIEYELSDEENFPSQAVLDIIPWSSTINDIKKSKERLLKAISLLNDEDLDRPPFPGYSNFYVQIHGLMEHLLYHMGQIRLIQKYLESNIEL